MRFSLVLRVSLSVASAWVIPIRVTATRGCSLEMATKCNDPVGAKEFIKGQNSSQHGRSGLQDDTRSFGSRS